MAGIFPENKPKPLRIKPSPRSHFQKRINFASFLDMAKKGKSRARVSEEEIEDEEINDQEAEEIDDDEEEYEEDDDDEDDRVESSAKRGKSLYEILGVESTASQQEIKKAYHKLALRLHPDKNPGDEEAKEKFQLLQKVISVLGDEEKRAIYDQTGCAEDAELAGDGAQNLQEYFRTLYKKVTEADIEEFEANYRGSDSEKKDLKDLYKKYKGNMNRLFCSMICSDPKLDSHRFKDLINEAIAGGELKETKAYRQWAKQVSQTKPPTNPLKRTKSGKKSDTDLYAIISQRCNQRKEQFDSMFSSIVAKCGGSKSAESVPEPSEEEFEAARKRIESRTQTKKGRKK